MHVVALLSIALLISGAPEQIRAQPPTEEYKVKAAFLFHFAQLVDWPAGTLGDSSVNLCIFDDEPRRLELQSTLEGKALGTRVLHILLLKQSPASQGCNILFLSHDEIRRQAAALRSVRGEPVLTVGESDAFLSDGGMIQLRLDADKIRFDINAGAANDSRLKISSRLLLLATSVTPNEREKSTYAR
jgi:hypothetical protein